jgi:hypothetical protein
MTSGPTQEKYDAMRAGSRMRRLTMKFTEPSLGMKIDVGCNL